MIACQWCGKQFAYYVTATNHEKVCDTKTLAERALAAMSEDPVVVIGDKSVLLEAAVLEAFDDATDVNQAWARTVARAIAAAAYRLADVTDGRS